MNTAENAYCRLCAELKPNNKVINLQLDEGKLHEIIEKLTRLNTIMDLSGDSLPKTVCIVCNNSLDNAFKFILNVERAQGVLYDKLLPQQLKIETHKSNFSNKNFLYEELLFNIKEDEEDENFIYEPPEDITDIPKVDTEHLSPSEELKLEAKKSIKKRPKRSRNNQSSDTTTLTWQDYNWKCSYCETQFPDIHELQAHSMQYHNCCNSYKCSDCKVKTLRLDRFLKHVKKHRKYLKWYCYKCNVKFTSLQEAMKHKSVHEMSKYICPGCNVAYPNPEELNQHSKVYYQAKRTRTTEMLESMFSLRDLNCEICKKTFTQKSALKKHLLIHTERKRDHICDKCGKRFFNEKRLAVHIVIHENLRPFQCDICKASFKRRCILRQHIKSHDSEKPFKCEKCGQRFRLEKYLTNHSILHTESLPHECSVCKKRFRYPTILHQHKRLHTGVMPYSCEVCQRKFSDWSNCNKHMKIRHGMSLSKKKQSPS